MYIQSDFNTCPITGVSMSKEIYLFTFLNILTRTFKWKALLELLLIIKCSGKIYYFFVTNICTVYSYMVSYGCCQKKLVCSFSVVLCDKSKELFGLLYFMNEN